MILRSKLVKKSKIWGNCKMKKILIALLSVLVLGLGLSGCFEDKMEKLGSGKFYVSKHYGIAKNKSGYDKLNLDKIVLEAAKIAISNNGFSGVEVMQERVDYTRKTTLFDTSVYKNVVAGDFELTKFKIERIDDEIMNVSCQIGFFEHSWVKDYYTEVEDIKRINSHKNLSLSSKISSKNIEEGVKNILIDGFTKALNDVLVINKSTTKFSKTKE